MDKFLNVTDASSFLGYAPYTLRKFVKQRKIKFYRHGPGGSLRFKENDLKAFLKGTAPKKSAK